MLPKLFFLHFEGTSFVADDDEGQLVAFLIGFLSQTDPDEAYIHFVGVAPAERGSGHRPRAVRALLRRRRARTDARASAASPRRPTRLDRFPRALGFTAERVVRTTTARARIGCSSSSSSADRVRDRRRGRRLPSVGCLTSSSRPSGRHPPATSALDRRRRSSRCSRCSSPQRSAGLVVAERGTIPPDARSLASTSDGMTREEAGGAAPPESRDPDPIRLIGPGASTRSRGAPWAHDRFSTRRSTIAF